jgi:hypothetical protein
MEKTKPKLTTVTIQVDKDFHRRLKHFLVDEGKTIKAVFMECMEARMAKRESESS